MYCPNCGTYSSEGVKFCYRCGKALPDVNHLPVPPAPAEPVTLPQPPVFAPPPSSIPQNRQPVVQPPVQPVPQPPAAQPVYTPVPAPACPPVMPTVSGPMDPVPSAPPALPEKPGVKGSLKVPIIILSVMCVLGLILFFLTSGGSNDDSGNISAVSDTPWFTIEDGTLYFDPYYYDGSGELTVPEKVNGETVLRLGENCFSYSTDLTTVILPDTLTEIGEYAFSGCSAMRGISIPDSVTVIGQNAFEKCTALEAVSLPGSIMEIGANAFRRCSSLNYIFYDGRFEDWQALYDAEVNPDTTVHCQDGDFPIG